jgi:flavin reductase (DIM6/NTAB) family NADH-FMN oxidoreductase RutF
MNKQPINLFDHWQETMTALARDGLLLCTIGLDGKPDTMAIGWMLAGVIGSKPIVTVLVRPNRFSFRHLEEVGEFTVNVLPPGFSEAIQFCGTKSGRRVDKFAQTGLTPVPAKKVKAPVIKQAIIHYECRVVHKSNIVPDKFMSEIFKMAKPHDVHRLYYGEALAAYAAVDIRKRL